MEAMTPFSPIKLDKHQGFEPIHLSAETLSPMLSDGLPVLQEGHTADDDDMQRVPTILRTSSASPYPAMLTYAETVEDLFKESTTEIETLMLELERRHDSVVNKLSEL